MCAAVQAAASSTADLVLAADRMFILAETFDVYVRDNPAILADLDLTESATVAAGAMNDFWQRLNANVPDDAGNDAAKASDRMVILAETFDLYVREEQPVASGIRLSIRALLLSATMRGFQRRLKAQLPEKKT